MARSYNQITIVGNVGSNPDIRQTGGGRKVANLSIATSPPWDDTKVEWHRAVAWGKLADIIEQYVEKGDRILIEGRLQYSEWTDNAGQDRKTAEINVDEMLMLGSRQGASQGGASSGVTQSAPAEDDLPF